MTYCSMKLKFRGESRGPNIVKKYCELRQIHSVRYPAEDHEPIAGEKSINTAYEMNDYCVSAPVYLHAYLIVVTAALQRTSVSSKAGKY